MTTKYTFIFKQQHQEHENEVSYQRECRGVAKCHVILFYSNLVHIHTISNVTAANKPQRFKLCPLGPIHQVHWFN